jgi:AcrR family transcriptional regulator
MAEIGAPTRRKPRADGQRNRAMILEAAKRVLTDKGIGASLDEIAQAAEVGNGTLYRHFPTRAALVEAVCREDTRELVESADTLASTHSPLEALSAWLETFVDYIATKKIIAEAASALVSPSSDVAGPSGADVRAALTMLFERVRAQGDIRGEFDPLDLMRAVAGVATVGPEPNWERNARRLVRVIIAGLAAGR